MTAVQSLSLSLPVRQFFWSTGPSLASLLKLYRSPNLKPTFDLSFIQTFDSVSSSTSGVGRRDMTRSHASVKSAMVRIDSASGGRPSINTQNKGDDILFISEPPEGALEEIKATLRLSYSSFNFLHEASSFGALKLSTQPLCLLNEISQEDSLQQALGSREIWGNTSRIFKQKLRCVSIRKHQSQSVERKLSMDKEGTSDPKYREDPIFTATAVISDH